MEAKKAFRACLKSRLWRLAVVLYTATAAAGGAVSLGVDGEIDATAFTREYRAGLRPGCHLRLSEKKELSLGLPVRYVCSTIGSGESNLQRISYCMIGIDIGLYRRIYANRHVTVWWGPELFGEYGLPATIRTTANGTTSVQAAGDRIVARGGFGAPITIDLFRGDWGIRLSERFLRIEGEGRYNEKMTNDNCVKLHIGMEKTLSPSISVLRRF